MTDAAPVNDQPVRERCPRFGRQETVQLALNLRRVFIPAESEAPRYTAAVRIDHNRWSVKRITQDNIRGFAADSRKPCQLGHGSRHAAAEFFDQLTRATLQRLRFGAKQSQRADQRFDVTDVRPSKLRRCGIVAKQPRGDFIDRFIAALRRENHRDQKLEDTFVIERHFDLRIGFGKTVCNGPRPVSLVLNRLAARVARLEVCFRV